MAERRATTLDDLKNFLLLSVAGTAVALLSLLFFFVFTQRNDAQEAARIQERTCDALEVFIVAQESALVAIFSGTVDQEQIEQGRAVFRATVEPALDLCRQ